MNASDMSDADRKERNSMAREICSHRGENPGAVNRSGQEGWEKYEPLAGTVIREAERLFALRIPTNAQGVPSRADIAWILDRTSAGHVRHQYYSPSLRALAKADAILALFASQVSSTDGK